MSIPQDHSPLIRRLISDFTVALPISQCISLYQLFVKLPYHITTFLHLTAFLTVLHLGQLKVLDLQFLSHPSCIEPPAATWEQLDLMLQTPRYQCLEQLAVSEIGVDTVTRSHMFTWGDDYSHSPYDSVACHRKMAELLPLTHGRRLLFYWNDPYSLPERVPDCVTPFLPIEVAERIMDFVAGTKTPFIDAIWPNGVADTLVACSLTCRDWRPRAQTHLFRAVSLSSTKYEQCNIKNFQSLLAQHPALSPFIRTCTVRDTPSPPAKSPSLHNTPFQLLSMLPQLKHLRLFTGTFYPPPSIAFDACMRRSSSIARLWIHKVAFYSVKDLRQMINGCWNLKELQLWDCMWHGKPKPTVTSLRLPTSVRLAEAAVFGEAEWIKDPRSTAFLQWLVRSGALVSAEVIDLPRFIAGAGDMLAATQSVIHACRSTLTRLQLLLSPNVDYNCCEFTFNRACCQYYRLILLHSERHSLKLHQAPQIGAVSSVRHLIDLSFGTLPRDWSL